MHEALRRELGSRRSVLLAMRPGRGAAHASRPAPRDGGRPGEPGPHRRWLRLARTLLVTPWFAAGAGIVIAAALAVDSPAALTYVPNDPGVHCPASGCLGPAPGHAPALATASPGVQFGGGAGTKEGAEGITGHGRAAGAGYHLGYRVLRHWPSGFTAMITLPPGLGRDEWSLQFAFSSARVEGVWGASWQPSGSGDSGTATGPWHGGNGGSGGLQARQMMITAAGAAAVPSECVLNGVSCQFGR
ncbi:MAG TPA: cellulose binding domain-containing protein [Streptosporangiaceae bacterium]|nr:cellulose binding domain-containing protein [Streptosporangiaceae bacterium]